jgi:hypothetical protein
MPSDQIFDLRTYMDHDVLAAYREYQPRAQAWWGNPSLETSKLGLDSTSARAMGTGIRGSERGPIALYEAWAKEVFAKIAADTQLQLSLGTQEGFDAWHATLAESLVAHWRARVTENNARLREHEGDEHVPANPDLSIAHRYKMVDLFVKYLRVRAADYPELARCCYEFGHIPLDLKSLAVLSAAFSGALVGAGDKFRMGHIVSEQMYRTCQRLARVICMEAGGSPLLLDVFAWHAPAAQQLYKKRPAVPSRKAMTRARNKARAGAVA